MDGENFMVPNPIKMDDLGGPPLFLETPTIEICPCLSVILNVPIPGFFSRLSGIVHASASTLWEDTQRMWSNHLGVDFL